ncbi:hypothetical protein A0H81_14182 [Grifola frondosa]|uniref:Uncharacterized protein n=1 Tax=Grifola frondosa TaxID=5627 RepID=A0A1C7LMG6_GRIFR|nr:hypothetical protein A0H81_14182 [Grifola frondosa]
MYPFKSSEHFVCVHADFSGFLDGAFSASKGRRRRRDLVDRGIYHLVIQELTSKLSNDKAPCHPGPLRYEPPISATRTNSERGTSCTWLRFIVENHPAYSERLTLRYLQFLSDVSNYRACTEVKAVGRWKKTRECCSLGGILQLSANSMIPLRKSFR